MKKLLVVLFGLSLILGNRIYAQKVTGVGPVRITVSDMARSLAFYTQVLPFIRVSDEELFGSRFEKLENVFGIRMRLVTLRLGQEEIQLVDYLTTGGRPIPRDAKSNDLSFQHLAIVVSDMDKAYRQLRNFNVEHVSTGPQTLPKSIPGAEGIRAFYFHDPDDHNLELIFFPAGKGDPRWQQANGPVFLGVDHTAIGISNTDESLKFYRDLLGLERKGDSWNKGTEQEHLNNVEGASLHITGLRAARGLGVEFLQYLVPGPGKKYPADTRTDDIWYWQTTLWTDNAAAMMEKLKNHGYQLLSKGLVSLHGLQPGIASAFIARDPDGHAVLIAEKE